MYGTVLTLSILAFILSISSLRIILLYYFCCRGREREPNAYNNKDISGSIALEESHHHETQLDNLSNHEYEEIPSVKLSLEDLYINDTISDQKKYLDNRSDTDEMPEMPKRIYFTLEDFTNKEAIWLYAELFLGHHDSSCNGLW